MTFANFWPEWVWLAENDVLEDEVSVTSELYGRKTRAHNLLRILVLSTVKLTYLSKSGTQNCMGAAGYLTLVRRIIVLSTSLVSNNPTLPLKHGTQCRY